MFHDPSSKTTFDQNTESYIFLDQAYTNEILLVTEKQRKQGFYSTVNIEKKQEEVMNWWQVISDMPQSAERTLLDLIIKTWNLFLDKSTETQTKIVDELLYTFQTQLAIEGLESEAIKDLIVKYKSLRATDRSDLQAIQLEAIYNKIVVFNIHQTEKLIHQNDKAAELIQGQDVILMVGGTGAGKSTTIQFLAGSEMEEVQIQGLTNIQPKAIKNKMLENVKSSPFAKSETLYITPVIVDTTQLGLRGKGYITLCDSPGFGDNRGTEIDIANGIGIIKAVHGCKSVRLAIVLGQKGLGERLEGLLAIVNILIEMIPNITEYFDCIQYVFTKYSKKEQEEIYPFILSKYENLNDNEKQNTTFVKIIEDLLDKSENNLLVVNPLQDEAKGLFSKLLSITQIKNPADEFVIALSEKSKTAIKDQMLLHKKSIINGTLRSDYELVGYKLTQMTLLYQLLNYDYIQIIYQECIQQIIKHIQTQYLENKKLLTRCFSPLNELTLQDMELYKLKYQEAKNIYKIKTHLKDDAIDESTFLQELQIKVQGLMKDLKSTKSLDGSIIKTALDKIKIVSLSFTQYEELYIEAKQHVFNIVNALNQEYRDLTKLNNFEESVQQFKQIQSVSASFGEHIQVDKITDMLNEIQKYTLSYLQSIQTNIQPIFEKTKLEKNDIYDISQSIEILDNAQIAYQKVTFFNQDQVKAFYSEQLERILLLFEQINKGIEEQCLKKDVKLLLIIKPLIDQLSLLQQITAIQIKTTRTYYKTIEQIIGYVQELKRDVDHILKQIVQKENGVNFQQLTLSLQILQNAEWIDQYRPGVYQDVMSNIREQILDYCDELKLNIVKNNLDLQSSDKIESVCKQMNEINEMKKLRSLFPQIETSINEINGWFVKQIDQVFQLIRTRFTLEAIKTSEIKSLDYKKAEQSVGYLQALQKSNLNFLSSEQYGAPSILYERFQDFLRDYKAFIIKEMQVSHEQIQTTGQDLIQNAQNLLNRIKEVFEIDKYPLLAEVFDDKLEILNHWQKVFDRDINEFSSKLLILIQSTNFQESLLVLDKVKAMSELDQFAGIQKFSHKYQEFQKQIISHDAPTLYKDAQQAILAYDYQKIAQILPSIEVENNALFVQQLKTLKILLNNNIEELVETLLNKMRSFFKQVEKDDERFEEKLLIILQQLKSYDNASKLVSNYFNEIVQQLMNSTKEQIFVIISKGLKYLLLTLDEFIVNNNYNEAGKLQMKVDTIKDMIDKYIAQEVKDEIDSLQSKLDAQQETLIKQYEENDYFYIRQNPLKEVFHKLSSGGNEFYRTTMQKLEIIITDRFNEQLKEIAEGKLSKIK